MTSRNDDGVQIIDITDPYNPTPVTDIIDDRDGFTTLSDATDIAITTIGSSTYALVISASGPAIGGVQIIDITTPSNPTAVSAAIAGPGNGYTQLDGTTSIDTITVDSRTYALVTSNYGSPNGGFEIIDITTPSSPYSVLTILDGQKGYHNVLNGLDVESVTLGSSTFVLVASSFDTSFEIISLDLSDAYIFNKNSATKYAIAGDELISRFAIDDTVVFSMGCSILGFERQLMQE